MKNLQKIILSSILFIGSFAFAQSYKGNGDFKVQAGFVGWGYGAGLTGVVDYGLTNLFSAGAGVELYFGESSNNFYLFGRGDLHLQKVLDLPREMDLYPGIDLGLNGKGLGLGGHLGIRYYFTDKIGAYAEIGSRGGLGISIKLN